MAKVLPFKGILPQKELADKIVTKSADNYSIDEAKKIVEQNNISYLSVIYPDFIDHQKTKPHSIERFQKISKRFHQLKNQNYFYQDATAAYYVYQQKHSEFEFTGIIAAISAEDYWNGNIKIHEQTLSEREKKLKEYLKYCKINAEPVLFFYSDKEHKLLPIIENIQKEIPVIEIMQDNVLHRLWRSGNTNDNIFMKDYFESIGHVFIADGHHRSASSALLAKEFNKKNIGTQYFLGAFFQEDTLKIYSFHRLLNDIIIPENFMDKLSVHFDIEKLSENNYPLKHHTLGMYWKKQRYLLKYKNKDQTQHDIDTEILYQYILKEIFLINDVRNNPSIKYFPEYTCSIHQAEEWVNASLYQIAFFTAPVSVHTIKKIALQNSIMPPKSTYILPKLLNGLVIYDMESAF